MMLGRLAHRLLPPPLLLRRMGSQSAAATESSDPATGDAVSSSATVLRDFVSREEEQALLDEVEPYLQRLQYEFSHWDDTIHGFRETERRQWFAGNRAVIQRVRDTAFPAGVAQLEYVHVLDLAQDGFIKPHVDSVKFCGGVIAGISLLSDSVMLLQRETRAEEWTKLLLPRRSLYILSGTARYDFTHAILKDEESFIGGVHVPRLRRISVMCRNQP